MAHKNEHYHETRFKFDQGRTRVWRAINEYLQSYVGLNKVVLDLGTGYGEFINAIQAKKKYALDISPTVKQYMHKDVVFLSKAAEEITSGDIPPNSVDVVFSSNLFEHLDKTQLDLAMKAVKKLLKKGGTLILIGPNFQYAYKHYFDDYTHKTVYTHISLADAMYEYGFQPIKVVPKFLPLTLKSHLPKSYLLTKLYLHSPVHPLGKQMLLVFEQRHV